MQEDLKLEAWRAEQVPNITSGRKKYWKKREVEKDRISMHQIVSFPVLTRICRWEWKTHFHSQITGGEIKMEIVWRSQLPGQPRTNNPATLNQPMFWPFSVSARLNREDMARSLIIIRSHQNHAKYLFELAIIDLQWSLNFAFTSIICQWLKNLKKQKPAPEFQLEGHRYSNFSNFSRFWNNNDYFYSNN